MVKDQNVPKTFNRRLANICIEAAKTVTNLLPDQPVPLFIYEKGPWWSIVHHLMQAVSVFLLALLYSSSTSQDSIVLLHYAKELVRWLRAMQDPLAERAYQMAFSTFKAVARHLSIDISDPLMDDAITFSSLAAPQAAYDNAFAIGLDPMFHEQFLSRSISASDYDSSMFTSFGPLIGPRYPFQD